MGTPPSTIDILPQPDDVTCGPTCLNAVYRFWGDDLPIERIVRAECEASNTPKPPEFELFDRFPLTDNDPTATERVAAAFAAGAPPAIVTVHSFTPAWRGVARPWHVGILWDRDDRLDRKSVV